MRNLIATCEPHAWFGSGMRKEGLQPTDTAGAAYDAQVQADRHHAWCVGTFGRGRMKIRVKCFTDRLVGCGRAL